MKSDLSNRKYEIIKNKKSLPLQLNQLDRVLSSIKTNKSLDPIGLLNKLFKPNIIGDNLIIATLRLVNMIKSTQILPPHMLLSNITTVYKNKGSRLDFNKITEEYSVRLFTASFLINYTL